MKVESTFLTLLKYTPPESKQTIVITPPYIIMYLVIPGVDFFLNFCHPSHHSPCGDYSLLSCLSLGLIGVAMYF